MIYLSSPHNIQIYFSLILQPHDYCIICIVKILYFPINIITRITTPTISIRYFYFLCPVNKESNAIDLKFDLYPYFQISSLNRASGYQKIWCEHHTTFLILLYRLCVH
uniref:Uncharacterized protein n=1 Tax=Cacopsylla melanoneura TaxID=428564 RepID=A0A8D8WV39_9HEMI